MSEPKSYQQQQFEASVEKAKEQLAGALFQLVTHHVYTRAYKSPYPEHKKIAEKFAKATGSWLWKEHGTEIESHLRDLYQKAIHPQHGNVHGNHQFHTQNAAQKAADDIWAQYE